MLTAPADLDPAGLAALLERCWGLRVDSLEYLRVGFGSHHWRAGDRFVTVDDLEAGHQAAGGTDAVFDALERAFRTAAALGLDFVVAPLPDRDGDVIRRLGARYAVTVFPLLEGESSDWVPYEAAGDKRAVCALLGRLHTAAVPAGLPRREDFAVLSRAALEAALDDLDRPWTTGPFAEPARALLATNAGMVRARLRDHDERAARVRARAVGWVVTHGEPHRANVVRGSGGRLWLVDWDTTLVAPRERDLWMVLDDRRTGWEEYAAATGATVDDEALELYRRCWPLANVAVFVNLFRRAHEDDEQTRASWENLVADLGEL
jgi:spectinomycin phosphotransferase